MLLNYCQHLADGLPELEKNDLTSEDWRAGMPTRISNAGPPQHLPAPAPDLIRGGEHIRIARSRIQSCKPDINSARKRCVQVVNVHFAVFTSGVNIARVRAT